MFHQKKPGKAYISTRTRSDNQNSTEPLRSAINRTNKKEENNYEISKRSANGQKDKAQKQS